MSVIWRSSPAACRTPVSTPDADRAIVGAIASLYVDPSLVRYGERLGLIVLGFGTDVMQVLNTQDSYQRYFDGHCTGSAHHSDAHTPCNFYPPVIRSNTIGSGVTVAGPTV